MFRNAHRPAIAATLGVVFLALSLLATTAEGQSENVTLLANIDNYSYHSDIWGYTSPGGTVELAIIGTANGTSFVDVTDPGNPSEVLLLPGANSIWRDIKTYDTYAYVVADEGTNGLLIVDLSDPLNPFQTNQITTHFSRAHNVWIDVALGLLFAVGADGGGTYIYDLAANPVNPPMIHFFNDFYVHDMYSQDGIAYFGAIWLGAVATGDLSGLPASLPVLDTAITDDAFCHNTWTSEDGNVVLTTDEKSAGHITIFDVSDPGNITRIGSYEHPTDPSAIIHNVAVKGDFAYVSWYKNGLEVIDISFPSNPQRVGFYDTFPGAGTGFDGAWGVYLSAESGHIYVSDMSTGLYVLDFVPNFGRVEGTVTESGSGLPIAGALVDVPAAGLSTTTDANGFYRFNLDAGSYQVGATAFGFDPGSQPFDIVLGETTVADFALDPLPNGSLVGIVQDLALLSGLPGATVEVIGTPLTTTTAPDGSYVFSELPIGAYQVEATLFGFGTQSKTAIIAESTPTVKNFSLQSALFADDFETAQSWIIGDPGDQATTGIWTRVDPLGTLGGTVQPEDDHTTNPAVLCFVTGQGTDPGSVGENDVDGGSTTLFSPIFDLTGTSDPVLRYHRWYVNDGNSSVDDIFEVDVSSDGWETWSELENLGTASAFWERIDFHLRDSITLTGQVQIRFIATDGGAGSIVEAGIDDFEIFDADSDLSDAPETPPQRFETRLLSALPNPFSGSRGGILRFQIAGRQHVRLEILDVAGRRVAKPADGLFDAGTHSLFWNGKNEQGRVLPAGIYFQELRTEEGTDTGKLVMIR